MSDAFRNAVIRPIVNRWLATSDVSWRTLRTPDGPPVARSEGPDPDRVLLTGAGISMGYGMESHDVALPGQLARRVTAITGRGVQVDVVAGETLTVEDAVANLTVKRLRELDLVIATPGTFEKLLLLPVSAWRARIELILDHFAENAPASLRVQFVAVPELSHILRMPWPLAVLADRSSRALNRSLAEACAARPYAEFVPFRPTEPVGRGGTGRTYERWADLLAPRVAAALEQHARASA